MLNILILDLELSTISNKKVKKKKKVLKSKLYKIVIKNRKRSIKRSKRLIKKNSIKGLILIK